MSFKLLAPTKVTPSQREWLDKESEKTCEPISSVLRKLIQEKVDKESKSKPKYGAAAMNPLQD